MIFAAIYKIFPKDLRKFDYIDNFLPEPKKIVIWPNKVYSAVNTLMTKICYSYVSTFTFCMSQVFKSL